MQNIIPFILLKIFQNKKISIRAVKVYNKLSIKTILLIFANIAPIIFINSSNTDALSFLSFVSALFVLEL